MKYTKLFLFSLLALCFLSFAIAQDGTPSPDPSPTPDPSPSPSPSPSDDDTTSTGSGSTSGGTSTTTTTGGSQYYTTAIYLNATTILNITDGADRDTKLNASLVVAFLFNALSLDPSSSNVSFFGGDAPTTSTGVVYVDYNNADDIANRTGIPSSSPFAQRNALRGNFSQVINGADFYAFLYSQNITFGDDYTNWTVHGHVVYTTRNGSTTSTGGTSASSTITSGTTTSSSSPSLLSSTSLLFTAGALAFVGALFF